MWPSSWRPSPSCSGRGTSMPASTTREWWRRSPSSRWQAAGVPRRRMFVTYGVYQGFGDLFSRAASSADLAKLFTIDAGTGYTSWISLTVLAMLAIFVLPRQFQVLVVENVDERHVKEGGLAVPALSPAHQYLRAASPSAACSTPAGKRGRRHVRAGPADGRASADDCAACLHRRTFRRDRHDHCRDGGAQHHGVQRPRHADAAASRPPASVRASRSDRRPAGDPARRHRGHRAARICLCAAHRRDLCPRHHRARLVRSGAQFAPAISAAFCGPERPRRERSPG